MAIDLNIYPLARSVGKQQVGLYSLYVSEPGTQASRSRKIDCLILYLVMMGDAVLRPDQQDQILAHIAGIYYKTPGSATAAMRQITDELNHILLEINLRFAPKGRQTVGWLTAVILRREQVYITQSGPMNAFWIKAGDVQHLCDYSMIGKGLGLDRNSPISYFQVDIKPNESLLLAAQPSPAWNTKTLASISDRNADQFRMRLFEQQDADINAILIQAQAGKGKMAIMPPQPSLPFVELGTAQESFGPEEGIPATIPAAEPITRVLQEPVDIPIGSYEDIAVDVQEDAEPVGMPEREQSAVPFSSMNEPAPSVSEDLNSSEDLSQPRKPISVPAFKKIMAVASAPLAAILHRAGSGAKLVFQRVTPSEVSLNIPASTMAFIAIAIPIFIVTLASVAYFQLGRAAHYDALYAQVGEIVQRIDTQDDLYAQRPDWDELLVLLDQIEVINRTQETQSLRTAAMEALDQMDMVKRVNLQPAIVGGLPETIRVTRMVAIDNDLYILDGDRGELIRAQLTSQGYQIDPSFQCGKAILEQSTWAPIIDIERWPKGFEPQADLIAIDKYGKALFCDPEREPEIRMLTAPAGLSFEQVTTMMIAMGDLYVLDPSSNGVWIYWKGDINREPESFFDVETPVLQDVVDLTVNQDELYLLHGNGEITLCVYNSLGVAPTRCSELSYKDYRSGQENAPLALDSPFSQILLNPPPDPSLFTLQPENQAIYHFSLRSLAFQRQYQSQKPLVEGNATSFAVDPVKRNFFLAIGNDVYYGFIP